MDIFSALGFASSLFGAAATIERGREIRRQKEAAAQQLEQERRQAEINTLQQHNDLLAELDQAEDVNRATFAFLNRDDDNSVRAFNEAQTEISDRDIRRIDAQGLYASEQLRLRSVGALRAGRAAERAANLNAMATIFSASYKGSQTGTP